MAIMREQLERLVDEMVAKGIRYEDAHREFEKKFIAHVLSKAEGNVGKVSRVEPERWGSESATVWMRIASKGRPVHADAHAAIRPRIFLEGNFFVDLRPGTAASPKLESGDTLKVTQTATPVQLDQVLTALQSDTREDLKTLLDEYGKSLDKGGAEAFNRSIPYWKPAYRDTAIVSEASLGEQVVALPGVADHPRRVETVDHDVAPRQR